MLRRKKAGWIFYNFGQTVWKPPFIVTRDEAGQGEDDKISVAPERQFCG